MKYYPKSFGGGYLKKSFRDLVENELLLSSQEWLPKPSDYWFEWGHDEQRLTYWCRIVMPMTGKENKAYFKAIMLAPEIIFKNRKLSRTSRDEVVEKEKK